jgi:hypothetical protein
VLGQSLADTPIAMESQRSSPGAVEASAPAAAASKKRSQPSQGYQKMSQLGSAFCTALEDQNMASAVTIAHAVEEHGCVPAKGLLFSLFLSLLEPLRMPLETLRARGPRFAVFGTNPGAQ